MTYFLRRQLIQSLTSKMISFSSLMSSIQSFGSSTRAPFRCEISSTLKGEPIFMRTTKALPAPAGDQP